MDSLATSDISRQRDQFYRDNLFKTNLFLAILGWVFLVGLLYVQSSYLVVLVLILFEGTCFFNYWLAKRALTMARHNQIIALGVWILASMWLTRDPLAAFGLLLVGLLAPMVLKMKLALVYVVLTSAAVLIGLMVLFPQPWLADKMLPMILLTILATGFSIIWGSTSGTLLRWAYQSTNTALERLSEVQRHRAQLQRVARDLDAAYHRLERTNDMLILARAEAEEARQARNQFALTVSHELRSPLNFIIGFSEMMAHSPEVYGDVRTWPPGLYDDIQEIYHSSDHLLRLVNDILDMGQAEKQQMTLIKEWTNLVDIAREAEVITRAAFSAKGLWLRIEVEPELPDVFVDRTRIRQVLINLLSNSLRFTEEGGITVTLSRTEDAILVCVQDTGAGIPAEDIPKVFQEFGQANSTVWRRREGSGLGIPISQRFVQLHGGRMWLESELGQGTSFYFTIPLPGTVAHSLSPHNGTSSRWRHLTHRAQERKALLILSLDPNPSDQLLTILEGFQVYFARSVEEAQGLIDDLLPQALIIDRPIADERSVQLLVRSLPYDLPVITTRLPGSAGQPPVLPAGVVRHLIKPVMREDLVQAVLDLGDEIRTLLVIDDDPAMVRFITLALRAHVQTNDGHRTDYRLLSAFDAAEALRVLANESPDVLILDLSLPDMNGWDLLAQIRQHEAWTDMPVILVTAYELTQDPRGAGNDSLHLSVQHRFTDEEIAAGLGALLQTIQPRYVTTARQRKRPGNV